MAGRFPVRVVVLLDASICSPLGFVLRYSDVGTVLGEPFRDTGCIEIGFRTGLSVWSPGLLQRPLKLCGN